MTFEFGRFWITVLKNIDKFIDWLSLILELIWAFMVTLTSNCKQK